MVEDAGFQNSQKSVKEAIYGPCQNIQKKFK